MTTKPYEESRSKFNTYATMGPPETPIGLVDMSKLQVELARWQASKFPGVNREQQALGVSEELGETGAAILMVVFLQLTRSVGKLDHAVLKHAQKIRGLDDTEKARAAVADGIADMMVFASQLATYFRLDIGVLFEQTAREVMKRDWEAFPLDADKRV